jgi:ribosomal protein S18 acetylase RimI-like enzyme
MNTDPGPSDLRPARPDDAPALAALGARSFVAKFGGLYRPADLAAFLEAAHSPERVGAELVDPGLRVALIEEAGAPVAFAKLRLGPGWPEHARGQRPFELKQLYTDPGATGRGLGARLLGWALGAARAAGADELQLSVYSGNTDAQRFYRRHGFVERAPTHFWVGAQRDEDLVFARLLDQSAGVPSSA